MQAQVTPKGDFRIARCVEVVCKTSIGSVHKDGYEAQPLPKGPVASPKGRRFETLGVAPEVPGVQDGGRFR